MTMNIRPAAVAGVFYPGEGRQLSSELLTLLGATQGRSERQPKAIVAPHAGYVYSGLTAAAVYARLIPWGDHIRRVVLLGPCHRVALRGLAAPLATAFATPLGIIAVDRQAIAQIADLPQVVLNDAPHAPEHSLEVHLPFLQAVLESFVVVPLAVGQADPAQIGEVLDRLWGGDETLIVISSDLSHFLPYDIARQFDRSTCEAILRLESVIRPEEACGARPINGFLRAAARHGLQAELIDLRNSGDTAGDKEKVVGYAAFAFYAPELAHA